MQLLSNLQVRDLSGGMISNAADVLLPSNTAAQSINVHYDVVGKVTQRYGTTQLGSTVETNKSGTGLYQYLNSAGTVTSLLAGFNTSVYAYNGSSYSIVRSGLDGTNVRFTTLSDNVFMVGGGADTMTWSGSGSFTSGSLVTGAPQGKYITTFSNRVFIAGNSSNPDRLFFSSIIAADGSITWDTSSTGFWIDVNPDDNNNIAGLASTSSLLIILKDFSAYRWNGTSLLWIDDIGTSSQESVVAAKGIVFFFSKDPLGIYATDGGKITDISRPIHDWLENMSASYYGSVNATGDDNHVYFNIGNVTKGGRTYQNVQLVYTISSSNWYVNSFAPSFDHMAHYITASGAITIVGTTSSGQVQTLFSGNTDAGTAITWEYQTKQFEFTSRMTTKTIQKVATFVKNGAGSLLSVSEDDGPFSVLGVSSGDLSMFTGLDVRGHYFSFKLSGINSSTPTIVEGMEVIKGMDLGYLKSS